MEHISNINNWKDKTILVADDDMINFKLTYFMLRNTGANIVWAKNGKEAVEVSDEKEFDAILMDVHMPIMNGKEAAAIIRGKNKKVPIIVLSASSSHEVRSWSEEGLSNGFLNKPVEINALVGTIGKYFGQNSLQH